MVNNNDRPGDEQPPRRSHKKLMLAFLVVLLAGLAIGAGMNLLFARPPVKKARKAVEQTREAVTEKETVDKAASGQAGSSAKKPRGPQFSTPQAMTHIFALSEQIGERPAGSLKESGAADYIVARLGEYGYIVEEQPFTMPDGFGSRNIIGTRRGTVESYNIVVAAHYDSARGSRGAVDNASGVGVVLELARVFSSSKQEPALQFVFLGSNRPAASDIEERLVGARTFVDLLGTLQKKETVGMIAVDSVGQGEVLALSTQGTGLQRLKDKLATFAGEKDVGVTVLKSTGDSDNIPFENSEVPAVWVQWCNADGTLSTDNRYASVAAGKVEAVGVLAESFLKDLTSDDLEELKY